MDEWDSVSNEAPPDSATDPWDAVSAPQPQKRKAGHSVKLPIPLSRRIVLLGLAGLVIAALASGIAWFAIDQVSGIQTAHSIATATAASAAKSPLQAIVLDPNGNVSKTYSILWLYTQATSRAPSYVTDSKTFMGLGEGGGGRELGMSPPWFNSNYTAWIAAIPSGGYVLVVMSLPGQPPKIQDVEQKTNQTSESYLSQQYTLRGGRTVGSQFQFTLTAITTQAYATATTAQQIYNQATSATPAMNDPLSDNSNGWNVFSGGINSCEFTGRAYHLLSKPPSWVWCGWQSTFTLRNFALQGQMNIVQGNEGGMVIGTDAINNYATNKYKIYINSQGTYTFLQELDTGSDTGDHILRSGFSPAIKTGLNQANVITAIVSNSNFYFYVNHQFVTSDRLKGYTQSDVGFSVQADNQLTEAAFSNMKLWKF